MNWFTSDWHLNENRLGILEGKPNLFMRPFKSIVEQNFKILMEFSQNFKDGDTLYHIGDVFYNFGEHGLINFRHFKAKFPNSKFILIVGNYDEKNIEELKEFFDEIHTDLLVNDYYLNHYPIKCKEYLEKNPDTKCITGHIHSLWKVQKGMINVSVDAWNFKPVSEEQIKFVFNAMDKFYDENVFPYN